MRVAVIGGGPGGYKAAFKAASLGAEVTLIERERLGGTCLNRGCIPTKTILRTAHLVRDVGRLDDLGLDPTSAARVSVSALRTRKDAVVDELVSQLEREAQRLRVEVVSGHATFSGEHTLTIVTPDGEVRELAFDAAIIATGSVPFELPMIDHSLTRVWTSDDAVALDEIPRSAVILGGGVIGVEFACAWSAFGTEVTVVELADQLLPGTDRRVSRALTDALVKAGVTVRTKTSVASVEQTDDRIVATLSDGTSIEADVLLSAAGRSPQTAGLGLEALGITCERGAILVDEHYRTDVASIFAIGDVIGGYMLAHVAEDEGEGAARNAVAALAGEAMPCTRLAYAEVPACVYTTPEIATVGLSKDEAKKAGLDVIVEVAKLAGNGRALAEGEAEGFIQLVAQKEDGRVVGCQIVGPSAVELIGEATLAIKNDLTTRMIAETTHAHPTISEALRVAAYAIEDKRAPSDRA